jgi:predicted RNase H-related nuclease YkuK (DUF458 family)
MKKSTDCPIDSDKTAGWYTGSGYQIEIDEMLYQIKNHSNQGGKVFIGTNSMLRVDTCVFATAICLYDGSAKSGGRYFFKRNIEKNSNYTELNLRMLKEVNDSIEMAGKIIERYPKVDIEIHVDVGTSPRSKTRKLVDALKGWATASGFSCKVKPNAWASASVADKHTK